MSEFIDLRKLSREELAELRKKVVALKKKGCSGKEIERLARVRSNRASEIWRKYLDGGFEGLIPGTRGRKPGEKALLAAAREREIRRAMIDNTPDELGMPYSLWTRQVASDFIKRKYGVRLSLRCVTNYFKKWGFVCTTPLKAPDSGRGDGLRRFIEVEFPAITRRAVAENVGVYWFCETWADNEPGQTGENRPPRVKMAAGVTGRGTVRFAFFTGKISQTEFVSFMDRLVRYADRKVFFIAEDVPAFHGKYIASWLKGRENLLEVFYHPEK